MDTSLTILKVTSSPSVSLAVILISTAVSSSVDAVSSSVVGASLTAAMVIVTVEVLLSPVPSLALKVKVSVPLKLVSGVYVTVDPERLVVPLEASLTME